MYLTSDPSSGLNHILLHVYLMPLEVIKNTLVLGLIKRFPQGVRHECDGAKLLNYCPVSSISL